MDENLPLRSGALPSPSNMVHQMTDFITCPFCAGHETVSPEAAAMIAHAIFDFLLVDEHPRPEALETELLNIRNAILNTAERATPVEEYQPPICPTPQKRRYHSKGAARHDAIKWKQHPYECACGYWHNSKQAPTKHAAKLNTPAASVDEFDTIAIDPLLL